jgi:hypothetical protein
MTYRTESQSGGGSSSESSKQWLPDWYLNGGQQSTNFFTDYLGNQMPTGGYQGERVAGFDPSQTSGIGQAQGYIDQSQPLYGQGAGMMDAAGNLIQNSALWNEQEMMRHMNPYLTGALTTVSNLANQNLFENVMPGVNSTFAGSGQFGSTRNGTFLNQAIRDNQQSISNTQANMLNDAYGQAADDYYRWGQQGLEAGNSLGQMGQAVGDYGIKGLNTGMNLGGLNQAQNQKLLDAQKAAFQENYTFPLEVYGGLSNAYNASVGRLTNQQASSGSRSEYSSSGGSSDSF